MRLSRDAAESCPSVEGEQRGPFRCGPGLRALPKFRALYGKCLYNARTAHTSR
jgi:hypothetical protein